ncbi:MAG: hypothetical protein QXD27_08460 [Metallosphaera sp.]|uniref:hypothetical protein n=1 Tax=Metallosphaera sp. TaxID=2020860 RepID=UPI00317438DD
MITSLGFSNANLDTVSIASLLIVYVISSASATGITKVSNLGHGYFRLIQFAVASVITYFISLVTETGGLLSGLLTVLLVEGILNFLAYKLNLGALVDPDYNGSGDPSTSG